MDYSPWSSKNLIDRNRLKKFIKIGIDVTYIHTNFGGVVSLVSEILVPSKTAKFPFRPMDYSPWSSKNLIDRNRLKKFIKIGIDVTYIHTNFGGVVSLVSEILVPSKTAKFPFRPMDYSPWSSKNLIDRNRLKKFIKIGIDVTYIHTNFGGVVSLVSEILVPSKTAKFPFRPMDYSPWSSKNLIDRNRLKKFIKIGIDVTYIHTNFGGRDLFGFGDIGTFKNGQISLDPWTIVHGHQKI